MLKTLAVLTELPDWLITVVERAVKHGKGFKPFDPTKAGVYGTPPVACRGRRRDADSVILRLAFF